MKVSKEIGDYDHKAVMESLHPELKEEPVSEDFNAMCLDENGNPTLAKETDFTRGFVKGAQWQKWKDSASVSEELEEAADNALSNVLNTHEIVNVRSCLEMFRLGAKWQKEQFEKDYTDLCNGIATVKGIAVAMVYDKGVADTKEQMMKNVWKPADGDDLPEIDREVVALIEAFGHYKVIFAHRVDENAEIHTSIDGKPLVLHPKRYDKGGWNIPNVKWWLDCLMPKEIEL